MTIKAETYPFSYANKWKAVAQTVDGDGQADGRADFRRDGGSGGLID